MYRFLRSLVVPDRPGEQTYKELVQMLKEHFCPKPAVISQRYKFNWCVHQPEECDQFCCRAKEPGSILQVQPKSRRFAKRSSGSVMVKFAVNCWQRRYWRFRRPLSWLCQWRLLRKMLVIIKLLARFSLWKGWMTTVKVTWFHAPNGSYTVFITDKYWRGTRHSFILPRAIAESLGTRLNCHWDSLPSSHTSTVHVFQIAVPLIFSFLLSGESNNTSSSADFLEWIQ